MSSTQFSFKKRRSTLSALCEFTDQLLCNMDKGNFTGALYLDLRKAFDTLNHHVLLRKLNLAGFQGSSMSLFQSYFGNRSQRTVCDDAISSPSKITIDVSQGSILGPLLFLVYIDNVHSCLEYAKLTLFADNMAICYSSSNPSILQNHLDADLQNVLDWLTQNKLILNLDKSKLIMFGDKQKLFHFRNIQLLIGDNEIEHVTTFRYLGLVLNESLSWHDHVVSLQNKLS